MDTSIDFLYLSEEDMRKAGVQDMKGCIDTMQEVFSLMNKGDYRMGGPSGNDHGIKMSFPKASTIPDMPLDAPDRRFFAMPAYLGGKFHMCGIKCYGSNPQNRMRGLPRSILMLTLMDPETGAPRAYMSANVLSAMRTGAVPGLGARLLSVKNPKVVSIIGPGVMGKTAMDAFLTEQPSLDTVKVKGRSQTGIDSFLTYCKQHFPGIRNYRVCNSYEEVCRDADILCFGTTNAAKFEDNPYIKGEWLKPGALLISTSALLLDGDFLADSAKCRLVTDNFKMYAGWGAGKPYPTQRTVSTLLGMLFYDLVTAGQVKESEITDIGALINGRAEGRTSAEQIVVYAVGGMPTEDVGWGCRCLERAKASGIGRRLSLWENPALA
ncbi:MULTISPECIES: tyramine oxidase subunit B [Caproicibacterium]|uniref:Tyramine oxidase subunit B n=1 Tax=Caproicibacterium argilliputei TaxID=3030016 RepID=A0AA97H1I5_9FIRM|nr:tyramine oxidase subunit B [Caproicibacterium argilliputei]WOC31740.1 tyramine oxidase subunit B [Caproicibacterium argilliputei]